MPEHCPPSIDIELGWSDTWWRLTLFVHVLAGVVPFFSRLGGLAVLLLPLLGFSLFCLYQKNSYQHLMSVKRLRFYRDTWRLQDIAGQWCAARLKGEQLITPFVTVLNFHLEDERERGKSRVVIFGDAVAKEPFRQLRVYLRMSANIH